MATATLPKGPLWMQNVDYPASWDRTLFDILFNTEGVLNGFTVAPAGGLNISVSLGQAVVTGDEVAGQGKYLVDSDASVNLLLAAVGVTRTEYVCLLINDAAVSGGRAGDSVTVETLSAVPANSAILLATLTLPAGTATITSGMIADSRTIIGLHIADETVTTDTIADGAVTANKIATGAVGSAQIDANAVGTSELAAASVTTDKLANGSVWGNIIADGSIVTSKLADGNVTTAKVADGNVTTAKLANGSVTQPKVFSPWDVVSNAYATARYTRLGSIVFVYGYGTVGTSVTLPVGYRPVLQVEGPTYSIYTSGSISFASAGPITAIFEAA